MLATIGRGEELTPRSIRSRALRRYWERADASKIRPDCLRAVKLILSALDAAREPRALNLPGLRLHALKGRQAGLFAVDVSGNWRTTFAFDEEDAIDIDLEDYRGR